MGSVLYRAWLVSLTERIVREHVAHAAVLPTPTTGAWSAWARWNRLAAQAALCVLDTKLAPLACF